MSTWTEVLQGMGVVTGKRPRQQKKRGGGSSAEDDAMMASVVDKMKSKFAASRGAKGGDANLKMEKYTIPELTSDTDWLHITGQAKAPMKQAFHPVKPKQILLVDIYSSWSGPCAAMEGHLRRLRHQFVATPDCLALAKACSDNIKDLEPFKSDPRPTFLIWARGGPVALLRGANRPLLTRLVEQEVDVEVNDVPRDPSVEIDFRSHRVIQCEGELAALGDDEVVHSIGSGRTDMLTSFFQTDNTTASSPSASKEKKKSVGGGGGGGQKAKEEAAKKKSEKKEAKKAQKEEEAKTNGEVEKSGDESKGEETEKMEEAPNSDGKVAEKGAGGEGAAEVNGEEEKVASEKEGEEEEDKEMEDKERSEGLEEGMEVGEEKTPSNSEVNQPEPSNGDVAEEQQPKKKSGKKNKKMETGLLKEILDAKPKKRYGM